MKRISLIILAVIFLVGLFLRTYNVTNVPPSMYWDEVSQGYNAYSVLTTGFDEHHQFLPITSFIAFGDYKAPVNIYLIALSMIAFGKTVFAIRFPSIILGSFTVILAFFLSREIFWENKKRDIISYIAAGLLAVSPWHILLSRASYEANVATFFTVLGLVLFFFAKRRNAWIYLLSGLSFVVGFYAFNAHRIFIPLIVLSLALVYWRELWIKKKEVLFSMVLGVVLLLPMVFFILSPDSRIRYQEVNIFSDPTVVEQSNAWLKVDNNSLMGKVFDNRRLGYFFVYAKHYFDFFNPQYLFFSGDINPRFSSQASGELWLWELPFILAGFYALFKMKNKSALFIILWFLFAPVAAATARETPHALRSETYIPVYQLISALGIVTVALYLLTKRKIIQYSVLGVVVLLAIFEGVYFLHEYFGAYSSRYDKEWQYGYEQAFTKTKKIENNYNKIVFSDFYGRAYVYYLFFDNIPPQIYWKEGNPKPDIFGLYNVTKVGKYEFPDRILEYPAGKILYVLPPQNLPTGFKKIDEVDFKEGKPAFLIGTVNE